MTVQTILRMMKNNYDYCYIQSPWNAGTKPCPSRAQIALTTLKTPAASMCAPDELVQIVGQTSDEPTQASLHACQITTLC